MTYIGSLSGQTNNNSNSSSGLSSVLGGGITGLASGINTDSMVNAMVQAAQVPLATLLENRQIDQWKELQYQRVNNSLSTLQNSLSTMKLQSTFLAKTVSSSDTSVVTGSAGTLAATGSYSVSVSQLARGATITSDQMLSADGSTTLSSLLGGTTSTVTLKINGQTLNFDPTTTTLGGMLSAISSNTAIGVSAFYDASSGKVVMQTSATGTGAMIDVQSDSSHVFQALHLDPAGSITSTANLTSGTTTAGVVEVNGQSYKITAGESLSSIESAINLNRTTSGVYATDDGAGHLVLQSDASGTLYSGISVSDPGNVLGLPVSLQASVAQDAVYSINNGPLMTNQTNSVNYNGLTLNLQATTNSPVNVGVSVDADTITKSIEDFIKQYNTTLQLMQGLYNQQQNSGYMPLTTLQVAQMTATQIDQWNQKAQSGMLAGDDILNSTMSNLHSASSAIVSGQNVSMMNGTSVTYNSLAAVGITAIDPMNGPATGAVAPGVTTTGWNTYGLLQINEDTLKQAIQADPQAVMRLFTNNPTLSTTGATMGPGIAVQMYNSVTSAITSLTQQAGPGSGAASITSMDPNALLPYTPVDPNADLSTLFQTDGLDLSFLGGSISQIDSQATEMQQQINDLRTRYQDEFSQMETSIANLNTQASYLGSFMGGSSSSPTGG